VGVITIPRFRFCVILLAVSVLYANAEGEPVGGKMFRLFLASGSTVQAAQAEEAPDLPQLKRFVDAGFSVEPNQYVRAAFGLGGFAISPTIPAGMVLYRGYSGFSLSGALEVAPGGTVQDRAFLFFGLGAAASVAKYEHTELVFLEYSASLAPGIGSSSGPIALRASLPLSLSVRGDAVAYSAGFRLSVSRSRYAAPRRRAVVGARP
jgi:hypothetical protein